MYLNEVQLRGSGFSVVFLFGAGADISSLAVNCDLVVVRLPVPLWWRHFDFAAFRNLLFPAPVAEDGVVSNLSLTFLTFHILKSVVGSPFFWTQSVIMYDYLIKTTLGLIMSS